VKRLVIHCDGNHDSGFGHFSRCLAILNILNFFDSGIVTIFIGNYSEHALRRLKVEGVNFFQVEEGQSFTEKIFEAISHQPTDFLLVDSYLAPQSFYNKLTQDKIRWGVIDDFCTQDFSSANLVINFRVRAEQLFQYHARNCALGTDFTPIQLKFLPIRKKNERKALNLNIESILICLGGNDIYKVSAKLLQTVASVFRNATINLLLSDNHIINKLQEKYKADIRIEIGSLRSDIENLMIDTDLIISGGGMLKYEASYCGIPNATLSQTEDQYQDTLILEELGVTLNLGLANNYQVDKVQSKLLSFSLEDRQRMHDNQLKHFHRDTHSKIVNILLAQF